MLLNFFKQVLFDLYSLKIKLFMKYVKLVVVACISIFGVDNLSAGNVDCKFRQLSIDDGLSNPTVWSIVQDHKDAIWVATQDGLNRYDGYSFKVYRNERNNVHSIKTDESTTLYIDSSKKLWVGCNGCLSLFNPIKDNFDNYEINLFKGEKTKINSILEVDGALLLGTNYGIVSFDIKTKQFSFFQPFLNKKLYVYSICRQNDNVFIGTNKGLYIYSLTNKNCRSATIDLMNKVVLAILPQGDSKIWLGTEGDGLFLYNLSTEEFFNFRNNTDDDKALCSNYIRSLAFDSQGKLWVGTFNGLSILEPGSGAFKSYYHTPYDHESLSQNSVRAMCLDAQGGMWLGTFYGGLNYYHPLKNRFEHITQEPYRNRLNDRIVSSIVEDDSGNIWIGTNDNGVDKYNPRTGIFLYFNRSNSAIKSNNIKCFLISDNKKKFFVGTHGGGFYSIDVKTNKLTQINSKIPDMSFENVYSLEYDKDRTILVGTLSGIFRFNESTNELSRLDDPVFNQSNINNIKLDSKKRLWIGTDKSLLLRLSNSNKIKLFTPKDYIGSDASGAVNSIYEDRNNKIWICTSSGLSLYLENSKFKTFTVEDGLPSNVIYGVIEDSFGRIWITTNNGLSCYNIRSHSFRNYNKIDGLPFSQFNKYSYAHTRDGKLYFGGLNGLITFYPELLFDNPFTPKPYIKGLKVLDKVVTPDDNTHILSADISETKQIKLAPDQQNFSLEFGVSNYLSGSHNRFAYKLEGLDTGWIYTSDNRLITYSNLPHGKYVFKVKAANSAGKWNNEYAELTIIIQPHWWQTWWAISLYFIITFFVIIKILKFSRQRREMDYQLRQERMEKEKNEEINQMKMNFFINISHEFKTPLTLILSPLQDVIEKVSDKWQKSQLINIQNNANKLLRLVTQLMDYRRAELGVFELNVVRTNPVEKISEIFNLFDKLAKQRNIEFCLEYQSNGDLYIIDVNYLDLILTNLLSNAFKFTPDGGRIIVRFFEDVNDVLLEVEDNGCGIASDKLDLIFDRFYQVENDNQGSGVGLSLVKRLVDLHYGRINVKSEIGKGSTFTVYFPQQESLYTKITQNENDSTELLSEVSNIDYLNDQTNLDGLESVDFKTSGRILIVEDNVDVLDYLKNKLSAQYDVITANNGVVALDIVNEIEIDLILTDVMMPVMDGIKFCKAIKQNIKTCHIPVIMLSAKSNIEDQLKGLDVGADDYVPKPFTYAILSRKISNTLISRKRSIEYYSKSKEIHPEKITFNAMDESLLKKALKIVSENIDNVDFTADTFCSEMCMSRSNLHIKLKAITGESTIDFIKKVRFNKACELLLDGRYSVAEISTMVGFNSPSYFTTSFKKYFGFLPSEYPQGGSLDKIDN